MGRLVVAYVVSLLALVLSITISYVILQNIIETQRTLHLVNTHINAIQLSVTDSVGVLNDYKFEQKKNQSNTRLMRLIEQRALASVDEISLRQKNLLATRDRLVKTNIWQALSWIFDTEGKSLNAKLSRYLTHIRNLLNEPSEQSESKQSLQIPVEAAGAKNGSMYNSFQQASIQLQDALDHNTTRIETVHQILTALVLSVMFLISLLVILPLLRKLSSEHQSLETANSSLFKIAYTDRETGLPNLDGLEKDLNNLVSFTDAESGFYLLLIRIKNLDEIYNLIGSHRASALLQNVASRLQQHDSTQQWCRSGEAEFSSLITEAKVANASQWVNSLQSEITAKLTIESVIVRPTVSLAVSRIKKSQVIHANLLWEHLSNARIASCAFKPQSCTLPEYHTDLKSELSNKNELINQIGEGIIKQQFVPFYQVKVDAQSGTPCSLEVLSRWRQPDNTYKSPGLFIPAAETSGLIVNLTYSIFDQVLIDIKKWCAGGLPIGRVAINVAADVLHHNEFISRLETMNYSLPSLCEGLEIEITENIALGEDIEKVETLLSAIQDMGISVAIDDFGTGYASLQTLIDMPLDVLKIDRSFVLPMQESGEGNEVVSAMISLSNKLNKKCVVEGVETAWQWQQLVDLGADELQGFYFHKPAPAAELEEFLQNKCEWQMSA